MTPTPTGRPRAVVVSLLVLLTASGTSATPLPPAGGEAPWRLAGFAEDAALHRRQVFQAAFQKGNVAWFAVSDGLYRFDGYRWRRFTRADGLPSDFVRSVTVTRDDTLWVGTDRGAGVFSEKGFDRRGTDGRLAGPNVRRIVEGADGALWFCCDRWPTPTDPGGLTRFKDGAFRSFGTADGLPADNLVNLFVRRDGRPVAMTASGIAVSDGDRWKVPEWSGLNGNDTPWEMAESPEGTLLLEAGSAVHRLQDGRWTRVPGAPAGARLGTGPDGVPWSVHSTADGRARFYRWTGEGFVPGSTEFSSESKGFEAVGVAPDGAVWAVGRGVIFRWENVAGRWMWIPGVPRPVGEDSEGGVWFADSERAFRLKEFELTEVGGLRAPMAFTAGGEVWGVSTNGLTRWKDGVLQTLPPSTTGMARIDLLRVDRKGVLWARGMTAENRLRLGSVEGGTWKTVPTEGLGELRVTSFEPDTEEGFWMVLSPDDRSSFSVYRLLRGDLRAVPVEEGGRDLSWPKIRVEKDRLFLMGYRGLVEGTKESPLRLRPAQDGGHVFTAGETTGDVTVLISQEGSDGNPRIHLHRNGGWLSHPVRFGQVMSLGPDGYLLVGDGSEIVLWDTRDWSTPTYLAIPEDSMIRSILRSRDGRIWAETRNGVVATGHGPVLHPETVLDGPARVETGGAGRLQARGVEAFSPSRLRRRYSFTWRLDGGEWTGYQDWPEQGLPLGGHAVGRHLFEVRARDGIGYEDPTPERFEFEVLPLPIEDRPWFRPTLAAAGITFAALSLALLGVGRRLRRQTQGLEAEVKARTAELRRDIQRREEAERSARVLAERLSLALQAGRFGVWDWDAINDQTTWDARMYEIFGLRPGEYDGSHEGWMGLILPEDRARVAADIRNSFEGRKDYVARYRIRRPDGRIRHIAAEGYINRDEKGRIVRAIGLNVDVTEQETTRRELMHREDRVRRLNECIANLVLEDAGSATDLDQLFRRLTAEVADAVQVGRVGLWIVDEAAGDLRNVVLFQADGRRHSEGDRLPLSAYPLYFAALREESRLVADDVLTDPRTAEMVEGYFRPLDIRSMLDAAVQAGGRFAGVLCLEHTTTPRHWHPDEVAFVSAVAALVAQALESVERRRAESELLQNQTLLNTTGELAHVGGWEVELLDGAPARLTWTDEVRRIHDVPPEFRPDLASALRFFAPESRPRIDKAVRAVLEQGVPFDLELTLVTARGRELPVRAIGTPVFEGPRVVRLVGALQDITDIRRAEAALREERIRLASIIEAACVGTWEWNVRTGETVFNERWAEIVGYRLEELQPVSIDTWVRLTHPEDLSRSDALLKDHFEGRLDYYECECRMRHKDGRWIWIQDRGRVITRGASGRPEMMFGTHTDVTERRRSEEKQRGLQELLARAERMESVGRLAGGVAHDFNNMLQAILGYATLALLDVPSGTPLRENLEEIRRSAERSAELTRQLLAFARKQTAVPRVVDLNQTIAGMLKMLRRLIGENIALEWRPSDGLWPATIDPGQVDQVLANLCVNARDAIQGAGRIVISTANVVLDEAALASHPGVPPGEFVRLVVEDNGHGMSAETLASIFEPFFTTKEVGRGTGLGLATVFGIVTQNRGIIDVASAPGDGARFTIHLPRSLGDPAADPARTPSPPPEVREAGTLLLVEDEEQVLRFTRQVLLRQGYTVLDAATPASGLALAERHAGRIDLLVTDVVMPGMDGHELHQRILARHPGLRCLYMSGYTADIIATHGVVQEGVHFLQKPFGIEQLVSKVREVLRDPPGAA